MTLWSLLNWLRIFLKNNAERIDSSDMTQISAMYVLKNGVNTCRVNFPDCQCHLRSKGSLRNQNESPAGVQEPFPIHSGINASRCKGFQLDYTAVGGPSVEISGISLFSTVLMFGVWNGIISVHYSICSALTCPFLLLISYPLYPKTICVQTFCGDFRGAGLYHCF